MKTWFIYVASIFLAFLLCLNGAFGYFYVNSLKQLNDAKASASSVDVDDSLSTRINAAEAAKKQKTNDKDRLTKLLEARRTKFNPELDSLRKELSEAPDGTSMSLIKVNVSEIQNAFSSPDELTIESIDEYTQRVKNLRKSLSENIDAYNQSVDTAKRNAEEAERLRESLSENNSAGATTAPVVPSTSPSASVSGDDGGGATLPTNKPEQATESSQLAGVAPNN